MVGVVTLKKREEIFSAGSMSFPSTITMPALQQTTSETVLASTVKQEGVLPISNEKGSYLIGRLFLNTADEQSIIGPSSTDDTGECKFLHPFLCSTTSNPSGGDDSGMDVDCAEKLGESSYSKVWDAKTGEQLIELQGHTHTVTSGAFASDVRIVSGSYDQPVRVWNVKMGEQPTPPTPLSVVSHEMKDPGRKEPFQERVAKAPGQRGRYNINPCDMCRRKYVGRVTNMCTNSLIWLILQEDSV